MQEKTKRIIWVLFLLIFLFPPYARSADSPEKIVLQDVSSDLSEGKLTVRFEFNQPVFKPGEPVFGDHFVQVDIPRAFVRPAKRFYYTADSRIPQVFVSQHNSRTLRLQFVLGEKLPHLRKSFQVEDRGRSLVFHIFKKEEDVLSEFLARAAKQIAPPKDQEKVTSPEPEQPTVKSFPVPLEESSRGFILDEGAAESPFARVADKSGPTSESPEAKIPSTPPLNFEKSKEPDRGGPLDLVSITVKTFTMFSLVLALMFLVFYLFKKFVLKNTIFGGNDKFLRVLDTGYLGPKKNIVLVEVAGEILVLGTSNDNISLLTHIQDKEKIEIIKASGKDLNGKKFWNQQKGNESAPQSQPAEPSKFGGVFANLLKQYSGSPSEKDKSVEDVTEQIRKNLGKLKTL